MFSRRNKGIIFVILSFIIAAGAFFRLFHLGVPAFRADTIEFWRICHQSNLSVFYLVGHWIEIMGRTGQFPLAMAVTKGLIDVFNFPPTDFWIRFPSAMFGVLTVPAIFLAASRLTGGRFGLFAAALLALNPFHIQMSREAYYYPPLLLGVAAMLWSSGWLYSHRKDHTPFPAHFFVGTAAGFLLLTYSHLSGWWMAAVLVPFSLGIAFWRSRRERAGRRDLFILLAIFFLSGLPLTFVSWGIQYFIYDQLHPEIKEYTVRYGGMNLPPLWDLTCGVTGRMTFGTTYLRLAFGALALAAGLIAGLAAWRKRRRWPLLIAGAFVIVLALYHISQRITASLFSIRHQAVVMPVLLVFMAYGIWHIGLARRYWRSLNGGWRRMPAWTAAFIALALSIRPAILSTQLTGKPTPYKEIAQICDRVLPPGVLVLVDRWFEPWNELRIYNSTNVFFAFTVPDEPMDTYVKNRWRDTALDFFKRFPDAGYLELNRGNRDLRGIVSSVPFARNIAVTNLAAMQLRDLGLAYREDCYGPDSNRLIIDLFFNTRADVVARARNEGQKILVLYGQGWSYAKLWQQTGDFRDWRVMPGQAAIDVYNLTTEPLQTSLTISAMAANGAKKIGFRHHNAFHDFTNLRLEEWRLPPLMLAPGLTKMELKDPMWPSATSYLFVDFIKAAELPGPQAAKPERAER